MVNRLIDPDGKVQILPDFNFWSLLQLKKYVLCFSVQVVFDGTAYGPGENFQVTLSKYQAFQFQETSRNDISGTMIMSNRPVAVFSGNQNAGNFPSLMGKC